MLKSIQFLGILHREVLRFCKVPLQTIGSPIISSFLYLVIFGVSLGSSIHVPGVTYLAFLVPGLIAMSIVRNAFDNASNATIAAKYMNELQDFRVTPLSCNQVLFAKSGASLIRGVFVGLLTFIVGQCFMVIYQKEWMTIAYFSWLSFFVVFGGLSFGFMGVAIGMYARSFEHVGAVSALILLPLIYLGGVFFDMQNLHPLWQQISALNPLFYIINGIRYGVLGLTDTNIYLAMGVTLAFCILSYIGGFLSLRKGRHYLS